MTSAATRLAKASVLFGLIGSGPLLADEYCTVSSPGNGPQTCPAGKLVTHSEECPASQSVYYGCIPPNQKPDAQIECTGIAGTIWCEAWPQTQVNNYQYTWAISSGYTAPQSTGPYDPLSSTQCAGNQFVTVTVTGPTGLYDSATIRVNCNGQ